MPFTVHPCFEPPQDENQKTWRYMDFTKFVSLLDRRALFFPSLHLLANSDPFEGALAAQDFGHREWTCYDDMSESFKSMIDPTGTMHPSERHHNFLQLWELQEQAVQQYISDRADYHVSCWHMNSIESVAMWERYVKGTEGIAIQSTYSRMRDAITFDEEVHIGMVKYIDYHKDSTGNDGNGFVKTLRKRKMFESEIELRMVYLHDPRVPIEGPIIDGKPIIIMMQNKEEDYTRRPVGTEISLDLSLLIEKVYVSPLSQQWFVDLVTSMLSHYNLDKNVEHSDLSSKPLI